MLSGPSTIYFSSELLFPPLPDWRVTKDDVIALYTKLRMPGNASRYDNLDLQADPPILSTRHANGRSACMMNSDRIRIEEDNVGVTLDSFIEIVETVLGAIADEVPFVVHRCMLRCTTQPNNVEDSIELLANRVAQVDDKIGPFDRPPSFFGVRFRFAPHSPKSQIEDAGSPTAQPASDATDADDGDEENHRGYVTLRFESYSKDIKMVWMEAAAQYLLDSSERKAGIAEVGRNIRETHQFLTDKAKRFLDQYDTPSGE